MSYNGTLNDRKNVFGSCTAYIVLFFVFLSIGAQKAKTLLDLVKQQFTN